MADPNDLPLHKLFATLAESGHVLRLLELARDEDMGPGGGPGDVTSRVIVEESATRDAAIVVREAGVVAGLATIPLLVEVFGVGVEYEPRAGDGERVEAGATIGRLRGDAAELLRLERTMLNVLGRLCGVATRTRAFVDAVEGTQAAILDTRKTTPGLRALEKYAVRCGGGLNHRLGLYDAVLIKDNHLAGIAVEDLTRVIGEAGSKAWSLRVNPGLAFVEVEVDSLAQLDRVLAVEAGFVDFVLLDNFGLDDLREAVSRRDRVNPDVKLEASGGVSLDSVRAIAETGVDRVSVGGLTHQATWVDVGLDFE